MMFMIIIMCCTGMRVRQIW